MRLDTANRSLLHLLGVALAPYLVLGVFGCAVASVFGYRLATGDIGALSGSPVLWLVLAFLAATALGAALGFRSLWRQWRATRELAAAVALRLVEEHDLAAVARRAGIGRLEVIDAAEPCSFTYGIREPRVVVSRGLLGSVSAGELDAVLAHERYHVHNHDTLKVLVARAVPTAFFFLPALGHLRQRYLAGRELAADRSAMRTCGRDALAGALYKVSAGPSAINLGAAAAIGGLDLLEARVTQLEHGHEPAPLTIPRHAVAATVVGVLVMTFGLAATVVVLAGWLDVGDDQSMMTGSPLGVLGAIGCGGLWLIGAVLLQRRLAARH